MLVTASKTASGEYTYNPVTIVFLTEFTKLVTCMIIYIRK